MLAFRVTAASNVYNTTGFMRTLILMLVFCFAGCAAGSCLSYGHSCWGAHGKRNGGNENNFHLNRLQSLSANGEPLKNSIMPLNNDYMILPQLITGQIKMPLSAKYRLKYVDISDLNKIPYKKNKDFEIGNVAVRFDGNDIATKIIDNSASDEDYDNLLDSERYKDAKKELTNFIFEPRRKDQEQRRYAEISRLFKIINNNEDNAE